MVTSSLFQVILAVGELVSAVNAKVLELGYNSFFYIMVFKYRNMSVLPL